MWRLALSITALFTHAASRSRDPDGFEDGSDLQRFLSRPDLAVPIYEVTKHYPDAIAPGYWFVAPYAGLAGHAPYHGRREHTPYQVGAHIYNGDGVLIWAGSRKYDNRNVFGFKPVQVNDTQHLALYISGEDLGDDFEKDAAVVLLNDAYEEVARFDDAWYDLHEFNVLEGGEAGLVSTTKWQDVQAPELHQGKRFVVNTGFREIELSSGKTMFDWDPLAAGVLLNESCDAMGRSADHQGPWDWFHINAVDKFSNGDYLVSARHTSTIYRISGATGSVMWRLGGYQSDFEMEAETEFAWQHHVRIHHENETHTLISIFDNHGEDEGRNLQMEVQPSAVKFITLSMVDMTAKMFRRLDRPDGGTSKKLGNVQVIGDDVGTATLLVDWAHEGYISEHTAYQLVMEAKFISDRMSSYRAYKSHWVGHPTEAPALKVTSMVSGDRTVSALHVSWNGATEVAAWAFFGCDTQLGPCTLLGNVAKTGFETSFAASTQVRYAYAEAIDTHGTALSRSATVLAALRAPSLVTNTTVAPIANTGNATDTNHTTQAEHDAGEVALMPSDGSTLSHALDNISVMSFLVYAFALFGLVSVFRSLAPLVSRRRIGYRPVSTES